MVVLCGGWDDDNLRIVVNECLNVGKKKFLCSPPPTRFGEGRGADGGRDCHHNNNRKDGIDDMNDNMNDDEHYL